MSSIPPDRRRDSSPNALGRPRGTLPPPELIDRTAPASAGQLVLEGLRAAAPVSRHTGPRAEAAWLMARIVERHAGGDGDGEREACVALARRLASRGTDLDLAVTLARRALAIQDEPSLRTELAGWLVGLGEAVLAAGILRGLCSPARPSETAAKLIRIGVLLARSGDATAAHEAFKEASALDPKEAIANELIGTLAVWTWEVPSDVAAASYLEAATRRDAAKEKEAAFEDRLRAFEIAPDDEAAANAVAAAVVARGRAGAADEVMRAHAMAVGEKHPEKAKALHARRMIAAIKEADAARAVGALLDGELDAEDGTELEAKVDDALTLAGLYEVLAVRLELRAERKAGSARSQVYQELARLYAGPLASPDRSTEAWIEALAADPQNLGARDGLRDLATTMHDSTPLVEALVRVGIAARAAFPSEGARGATDRLGEAQAASLRELATFAEDKLADAGLAGWAYRTLEAIGADERLAQSAAMRLAGRMGQHEEAMTAARRARDGADSAESRLEALRRLAALYRGAPDETNAHLDVLAELTRALPSERAWSLALERLAVRTGNVEPLEAAMRSRVEPSAGTPRGETVRARLTLAAIARRRGDEPRALTEIMPALIEAPGHRGAASTALVLATRTRHSKARADAVAQLAGPVWPALRSVLLAVAAELYLRAGDREAARRAAEQACEADPTNARAVAVLAIVAGANGDRVGAAALERAMGVVAPRGALCDQLAQALESLGELSLSLAWTQRWLALRPGSRRAISELVRRAVAARDGARLADALSWVLAQPEPLGDLAEAFAGGVHVLYELDAPRALALARRSLDVFGPRVQVLRERFLELADRAGDAALAIATLERWVACGAEPEIVASLFDLCRRRADAGDHDGAARELARAAERGGDPANVLARAGQIEKTLRDAAGVLSSDGLCALAECRARALGALASVECAPSSGKAKTSVGSEAAYAWRELGSLRWDLADDRLGGEEAFFAASRIVPDGIQRYARDLCEFAGVHEAIERLLSRSAAVDEPKMVASLLVEAADVATQHGLSERALTAAARAIDVDPSRADAIALVERNAHLSGGLELLDAAYSRLADAALGCYGRRAAHYRGARQFERRGSPDRAFRHAVACFEAVPAEGTTFLLLARLAERVGDPTEAVRALERVADGSGADQKSGWLKRAAGFAGKSEEGARSRFDLLLKALNVRPDPATILEVGQAMRDLVERTGEGEACAIRFERAVRAALGRLDGPDGARAAVAMARVALEGLDAPALAALALERAMAADGDIDEYMELAPLVPALARERQVTTAFVESVRAAIAKPYSSVGTALLRLASRLADSVGDASLAAHLLVHAAQRAPDDDALVDEAHASVARVSDETARQSLDETLPVARRLEALLHVADQQEKRGEDREALATLERLVAQPELPAEDRSRVVARIRQLLGISGRTTDIEGLLRGELARADVLSAARLQISRDLGALLAGRGHHEAALEVLSDAAQKLPFDKDLLGEVRRLAHRTGDRRVLVEVLARMAEAASDDAERILVLRELAPLSREVGDYAAAVMHYEAIARIDPHDAEAMELLEEDANSRSDHEALALMLARRVGNAPTAESRKTLRLRRAAVLEQRLGRLDEASAELEELLQELPKDVSALRYFADLQERLGAPARAATVWRKLGELSATTDEQADYGLRAATCSLAAGDVEAAKALVEGIASIASREAVLELRVGIARTEGNGAMLGEALDALASSSHEPAERRAEMLLEAARALAATGDDAGALDRAHRAARLVPLSPDAVLEARRLEYRVRGTGTPRDAQAAVDDLQRIARHLRPEDVELHAFLMAEELDTIQGGGAGMRELSRRHAEVGPLSLIALGMAERLVRNKGFDVAVPLFERALDGDLRGVRSRGRVALAAAEAAISAGELDLAARMLDIAVAEADTRLRAQRRQLELVTFRGDPVAAKRALEELARQVTGIDRARVLGQIAQLVAATDPRQAARLYREAIPLSAADRALHAHLGDQLARLREAPSASPSPTDAREADAAPTATTPRPPPIVSEPAPATRKLGTGSDPGFVATIGGARGAVSESASTAPTLATRTEGVTERVLDRALGGGQEAVLFSELLAGSYEAGERLIELYGERAHERVHDVLAIRKQQAATRPGDRAALERLHAAALADKDAVFARAIQHVLRAFDPAASPLAPPALGSQPEAPQFLTALLFRSVACPLHEALLHAWETGMFRKDAAHYGLTGIARVQATPVTPLSQAYGDVARLLGLNRSGLFHRRVPSELRAEVTLLAPPAVVLYGDVQEESTDLLYVLGSSLAGTMGEYVLTMGLGADALRTLLASIGAAFGPVGASPPGDAAVARMAQDLWQFVGPRTERRLREICGEAVGVTFEVVVESTHQALRRAGLFASGSLPTAVRQTIAELGLELDVPLTAPRGLARACERHSAVADLVRLATRVEYAEARWQSAPSPPSRRSSTGRFRTGG